MTAPEVVPCGRCGRPLSDPESRTRGYGPDCWRNEHGSASSRRAASGAREPITNFPDLKEATMTAARDVPLFDKPGEQPMRLSKALSGPDYRLRKDEKAKWTNVNLKTYRPCQECAAVQHETGGAFGPRRQIKKRRRVVGGKVIEMCQQHAQLWRELDAKDSGIPA